MATEQVTIQTTVIDPLGGSAGDGTQLGFVAGRGGDLIVSQGHGRYYDAAYRGHLFCARTPTAGVTIPIFSATAGTYGVLNPAGSGKNLEILRVDVFTLSATEAVVAPVLSFIQGPALGVLLAAAVTAVTAGAGTKGVVNMLVGQGANPVSSCYSAFTQVTQADLHAIAIGGWTATAASPNFSAIIDGGIVVPPGTMVSMTSLIAASGGACHVQMIYEEVPV